MSSAHKAFQAFSDAIEGELNLLADPGNAGTISVDRTPCRVSLVTTGAQTRTLAAPPYPGMELMLEFKTDGGDCVVAAATGTFNATGNNRITLNDAGDICLLRSVQSGATNIWRIINSDGSALSTV